MLKSQAEVNSREIQIKNLKLEEDSLFRTMKIFLYCLFIGAGGAGFITISPLFGMTLSSCISGDSFCLGIFIAGWSLCTLLVLGLAVYSMKRVKRIYKMGKLTEWYYQFETIS